MSMSFVDLSFIDISVDQNESKLRELVKKRYS